MFIRKPRHDQIVEELNRELLEAVERADYFSLKSTRLETELDKSRKQVQELEAQERRKWEGLLRDTEERDALQKKLDHLTKVRYAVTPHINDVQAVQHHTSLKDAVEEHTKYAAAGSSKYRIFAIQGNTVTDVTDSKEWDETLPVSNEREDGGPMSALRRHVESDLRMLRYG